MRAWLTRKITRPRLQAFLERYKTTQQERVLNIGCGQTTYAQLFPSMETLDIAPREHCTPDHIADAHDLRLFGDGSFDVILCTEVLEHLHSPHLAIAEFRRILKPGGLLLLSTRFIFPLHDVPHDYYRYTPYGLRFLLREFTLLELVEETNTMECLAVLFQRIGFQCTTLWSKPMSIFWLILAKIALLGRKSITRQYGDISRKEQVGNILSSGFYVAARTPGSAGGL